MEAIPKLEELIKPHIGKAKITSCSTKNLIAPGENYGSIMLAIDLELDGKEKLYLVGKVCPTSEYIRKLFNIPVTFKKEVVLYKTIAPLLQEFQRQNNGIPFTSFAKCYGSRFSLDPNVTDADEGCCLLLENLKVRGFAIEDRMVGFNLDCARFLVQDLAKFHSIPIAYKLREPDNFKKLIYENICAPSITKLSLPPEEAMKFTEELIDRAKLIKKYEKHLPEIEKMCKDSLPSFYESHRDIVEPFATIVHSDFWTNNTMIKKDSSGRITDNYIVDYQLLVYGSPLSDLMFFLYSSVQTIVLKEYYQELIDLYYETFINELKALNIKNVEQFSKKLFCSEIGRVMIRYEMFHCLLMLTPIYTKKEKATDFSEIDMSTMNDRSILDNKKYYERMEFLLDEFIKRGWLKLN